MKTIVPQGCYAERCRTTLSSSVATLRAKDDDNNVPGTRVPGC